MTEKPAMSATEIRKAVSEWAAQGFAVKIERDGAITVTPPAPVMSGEVKPFESCGLYRYYDDGGSLLYIGITNSLDVRDRSHWASSAWRLRAAHVLVEHYPHRMIAEHAEAQAIADESPPENRKWPTMRWTSLRESRWADWLNGRIGYRGDDPEWRSLTCGVTYADPKLCPAPEWSQT